MTELQLDEDILMQMGLTDNESSGRFVDFDDGGTMHVRSHDEEGEVVDVLALTPDDGTCKTIDSTGEENSLREDISSLEERNKRSRRIFRLVVAGMLIVTCAGISLLVFMR